MSARRTGNRLLAATSLAAMLCGTIVITPAQAEDVTIPDPQFRTCLKKHLGNKPLTKENLGKITQKIDCSNYEIQKIEGINYLTAASTFLFDHNQITDLTPIRRQESTAVLSFAYNQISNLSALQDRFDLDNVSLDHNQISNVSPLKGIGGSKGLTTLYLDNNQISDVSPLKEMTIRTFSAENQRIVSSEQKTGNKFDAWSDTGAYIAKDCQGKVIKANNPSPKVLKTGDYTIDGDELTYLKAGEYQWSWSNSDKFNGIFSQKVVEDTTPEPVPPSKPEAGSFGSLNGGSIGSLQSIDSMESASIDALGSHTSP